MRNEVEEREASRIYYFIKNGEFPEDTARRKSGLKALLNKIIKFLRRKL